MTATIKRNAYPHAIRGTNLCANTKIEIPVRTEVARMTDDYDKEDRGVPELEDVFLQAYQRIE